MTADHEAAGLEACSKHEDGQHCNCWYDGRPCCACGSDAGWVDGPEGIDARLLEILEAAGGEWGPLGVAVAAAKLTDRGALLRRLSGTEVQPLTEEDG